MKSLRLRSFKNKVFLTFALVYFLVLFLSNSIVIGNLIPSMRESNIRYEQELVRQSLRRVDDYLKQINLVSIQASYSSSAHTVVSKNYDSNFFKLSVHDKDRIEMFKVFQDFSKITKGICSIFVYNLSGYSYYYSETDHILSTYNPKNQDWYSELVSANNYAYIIITGIHQPPQMNVKKYVVSLIRNIRSLDDFSIIGQSETQINPEIFRDVLNDGNYQNNEFGRKMTLVDASGLIIYSTSDKYNTGQSYDSQTLDLIYNTGDTYSEIVGPKIVNAQFSAYSNWLLIGEIEKATVFESIYATLSTFLIFSVVSLVLTIFLGFIMSRSLTRPIALLQEKVTELEHGNFDSKIQVKGNNELSHLSERFDQMSRKLDKYVKRIYAIEGQKRESEILALQTQINPHFVFNTLNTIKYLATLQNAKNIIEMLDAFMTLMKAALKSPNELIFFAEEFTRLDAFIHIQTISSFGKIKISIDCDQEVLHCMTVGLILQPLLENAVFHGIKPKMKSHQIISGNIWVTAKVCDDSIHVHIVDDGIGMSLSTIDKLFSQKATTIGIPNVNLRIKLRFGNKYGLSITSEVGTGCDVFLLLPIIKKEDNSKSNEIITEDF